VRPRADRTPACHRCWTSNQIAAVLAALILAGLICFQLLLAAGAPLGHYAWGGAWRILPAPLRVASVVAAVIYLFTGAIILDAAGVADLVPFDSRVAVWVLAGLFGMGVLMNAISRSTKERRMALVALALSVLCVIVAAAPA
jgi:hypothetical protein